MSNATPPPDSGTPSPRRIRLDAAGWSRVRAAAAEEGLDVGRLPSLGDDAVANVAGDDVAVAEVSGEARVREALEAADILDGSGRLTRTVYGALAVLTTAPLTVSVEHVTRDTAVQGVWRSLGLPTAGVVVEDGARDGHPWREIELQVLAGDDLVDLALEALGDGGDADRSGPDGGSAGELSWSVDPVSEVEVGDLGGLPDGVLVDGEFVARATVSIAGPVSTSTAQLVGDGSRWWQVGASDPEHLRFFPVDADTMRAALVSAIAGELYAKDDRHG